LVLELMAPGGRVTTMSTMGTSKQRPSTSMRTLIMDMIIKEEVYRMGFCLEQLKHFSIGTDRGGSLRE